MNGDEVEFWAKTTADGQPGLSVRDHCLNVGCVAAALRDALPTALQALLPPGAVTLAALHDVGKISAGFLRKCPAWLIQYGLAEAALEEYWQGAESDHSVVSQFCLQSVLKSPGTGLWAVAVGAHHGRVQGRRIPHLAQVAPRATAEAQARQQLVNEFVNLFGALPTGKPASDCSDLWFLAGLITVADWIGSNERFFSPARGLPLDAVKQQALASLASINWAGGQLLPGRSFAEMFGIQSGPNALQNALEQAAGQPGLFIVEGPMGCGKTEAALVAAHKLIASGQHHGIYFGLPTQVTSSRIHRRVGRFLEHSLAETANFRLAHSASWLDEEHAVLIHPVASDDGESARQAAEVRSWFASSRHALLARYGVGTVDQALQGVVAVKHFFVRRFGLAGKVVILDEVHSYDVYTGSLITQLVRELLALRCSVIVLSATLTRARRQELLAAAGSVPTCPAKESLPAGDPYPLITVANASQTAHTVALTWPKQMRVHLRLQTLSDAEIIAECLQRAELGQHVLWLRNTVVEAQASYRAVASAARAGIVRLGLVHSRFPFFRREELEADWLERLGKDRVEDGVGSVLVATQVVEQSVDIDLDFIVSDLAPTDMLLQRMGRLWRHSRPHRMASVAEFWITVPAFGRDASARNLKSVLGRSGRVYAPYVLVRTAHVWAQRETITLPGQIREVLEATYAEGTGEDEPAGWRELRAELDREKAQLADEAKAAMLVLGRPSQADREEVLTRRAGAPTRPLVLLRSCEPAGAQLWRLTTLDGTTCDASGFEWTHAVARAMHRNLVRTPAHEVPAQTAPPWLALHVPGRPAFAVVQPDGRCSFPEAGAGSRLVYDAALGLHTDSTQPQPQPHDDDDEFDY